MIRPAAGSAHDRRFMEQALALGALAEGTTSPNPRVGCLLVGGDGAVLGRGLHRAPGLPHAEAVALAEAGARARGATLYVTLEPCAHEGRTPPCADLLVASGVRRVVAALQDPNPLVDGRGFERLRQAGIAVEVGLLAEEACRLNEAFFHSHRLGRPLVTLKAAVSLDGRIAAAGGSSRWITGSVARRFAHRLRLRHDAVLVGAETVRRDDPQLTVRLPGVRSLRHRVVLAPRLDLDPQARLFQSADGSEPRPRVYVAPEVDPARERLFQGRADVVRVPEEAGGGLDLGRVLGDLAGCGVQSILVEGGARTFDAFLEAGLADRAALFFARSLLGAGGGTALLEQTCTAEPAAGWRLERVCQLTLAEDLLLLGLLQPPRGAAAAG